MLFAMPQLTLFMLATAYVCSGPYLMFRGDKLTAKAPGAYPHPVGAAPTAEPVVYDDDSAD